MKNNKYQYKINGGYIKGFFNIYQARNGKIYVQLGNNITDLTYQQIEDLKIDVYELDEFSHEDFIKAYSL